MSGVRMLGGWLVDGFFGILTLGALAAGDGVSGTVREILAAAILLAATGLAIPRTRARIGDASGRTVSTRLVAALLVVGIGVAPAVDPGAGPGTDGENAGNALEEPDETGGNGSDPGGEETATGSPTRGATRGPSSRSWSLTAR